MRSLHEACCCNECNERSYSNYPLHLPSPSTLSIYPLHTARSGRARGPLPLRSLHTLHSVRNTARSGRAHGPLLRPTQNALL